MTYRFYRGDHVGHFIHRESGRSSGCGRLLQRTLQRLIPYLPHSQAQLTIARPSESRLPGLVRQPVLPGGEIDHVGVGEWIAPA